MVAWSPPRKESAWEGRGARDLFSTGLGGGEREVLSECLRRLVGGERDRRRWRWREWSRDLDRDL